MCVVALIVALLFLIVSIRKAQRFGFLALYLVFERRQCDLTNALVMTKIKSEEEGEELWQDGGKWRGYIRECKDGSKKCIEILSCFRYRKTTLEFLRRHLIFE